MPLRLHHLEGFFHVGAQGGYARAAAAMPHPVTESAVYQQVRKLEAALRVRLAQQAGPRLTTLTPEGRVLHDFVAPFFLGLPAIEDAVRRGGAGKLVVATDGAIARAPLARAIAALRGRSPRIAVRVTEVETAGVAAAVRGGTADAGLSVLGPETAGLREEALLAVRVALALPPGHALAGRRRPALPADLDGLPLCVYERGNAGRALLERAFAARGLRLAIAAEASSVEALEAMVAAGVGPAVLPIAGPRRGRAGAARRGLAGAASGSTGASRGGTTRIDLTALLGTEPIRYGLTTRADRPRHAAISALRRLLVDSGR